MKRVLTFGLASVMIFSLLTGTGCGKKVDEAAQTTTTKAEATVQTVKEEKPVKLKFMHWWSYVDDKIMEQFLTENPNIKIEMDYTAIGAYPDKIKMLSASNDLPDVFAGQGSYTQDFIRRNMVMKLNDTLKTPAYDKSTPFGDTINEVLMRQLMDNRPSEILSTDEAYSVPFGATAVAVVYNKTIFKKVGISVPKTWDEMLSNCEKLKTAGYIPLSFTGKVWGDWYLKLSLDQYARDERPMAEREADWLSGKKKFTDEGIVQGFSVVKNLWDKGYLDPGGFLSGIEESQALFVQGKMAQFFVVPENFVTYLIDNMPKDVEIDAFPMPAIGNKYSMKAVGGASNSIYIKANPADKAAAEKLMKYMVSETMFKKLAPVNVVPSVKDYNPPADNVIMKAFADSMSNGFYTNPMPPFSSEFSSFLYKDAYARMLLNNISPKDITAEIQKKYEDLMIKKK